MKQKACSLTIIIAVLAVLFGAAPSYAWYYAVGASTGGDADANGFTVEIGKKDIVLFGRTFLAAAAVPVILHGDSHVPDGTNPGPVPHDDFTRLGEKNDGTERGLIGKIGTEIKTWDLYVNLILGASKANTVTLARSNITQEYYIEDKGDEINGIYGLGLSYFPEFMNGTLKMNFQLDIDNRRGVTGYVGWCW
jgi:hypothetical protein